MGLTQKELAEKLNCSRVSVANIEIGVQVPSLELAVAMIDLLDFDLRNVDLTRWPKGKGREMQRKRKGNKLRLEIERLESK